MSGALAARATAGPGLRTGLGERTLAGCLAAAFPDIDYALVLIAPLDFLNWHRGATHSLVLLPFWALILAATIARMTGDWRRWRVFYGVCALGLAAHIAGDLVTIYGTRALYPLVDTPLGLGIAFDVDPYIAAIVAMGFAVALVGASRPAIAGTLVALIIYLGVQSGLYTRTIDLGHAWARGKGISAASVYAYPQPFGPVFWNVVVADGDSYFIAHVNHLAHQPTEVPANAGLARRMLAAYRPPTALEWTEFRRFGDSQPDVALAHEVWRQEGIAAFRRFAVLPALYRVDRGSERACVWFTDLRHMFAVVPPTFRYGMCRSNDGAGWKPYRLRYFSANTRQAL